MPHLATRPTMPVTPEHADPTPDGPRWGLVAVTALAAVLGLVSLLGTWLNLRLVVDPVAEEAARHGIGYFGALGISYGVGLALTLALVGLALWRPGHRRAALAGAALGVGLATLLDLVLVVRELYAVHTDAASTVAKLRAAMDTLPAVVEFRVESPGAYTGFIAMVLLVVVASQLLRPPSTVLPQVVVGAGFAVAAAVAPWSWIWIIDDKVPDVPFQVRTVWVWSAEQGPVLIAALLALLLAVAGCLRAPGYHRARWTVGTLALAMLVYFVAELIEDDIRATAYTLRNQVSEVPGVTVTGAGSLLAISAALLAVATVRAWWHGREEVPESTSDSGWLPEKLRDRR